MIQCTNGKFATAWIDQELGKGFSDASSSGPERNIAMLDVVSSLEDLKIPPSNNLERLSGDRMGQHSIRINRKWRLCFSWDGTDAHDVEIVDYH